MAAKYPDEIKLRAETLYYQGVSIPDICKELALNNVRNVQKWAEREGWNKWATPEQVIATTSRRLVYLTDKMDKTGADFQEIEFLHTQLLKHMDLKAKHTDKAERSANSKEAKEKARAEKKKNNDISEITLEAVDKFIDEHFYEYQKIIFRAGEDPLTSAMRMVLKPRQAGGTWGLAVEALRDAVKGQSTAFISATKRQAEVFKAYITAIAREFFDTTLTGSPIKLSNGVTINFLSPNSNAQSICANVVYDEYFWTANFTKMEDVAGAMATRGDLKTTFISTPSSIGHEAYEYWNGERFNKHKSDADKVHIGITSKKDFKELRTGRLDPDGIWRMRFTIWDAWEMGLSKEEVKLEKLRIKYPDPQIFACLFECQFIDDTASVFNLSEILACAVDTKTWTDIDLDSHRPYGNNEVTSGYEPAGVGDNSSFMVMTRPASKKEKFRLLENNNWRGIPTNEQCQLVKKKTERYNITYMEIDNTGPGAFLADFVQHIYPDMVRRNYSVDAKTRLVQKGKQVFADRRFEYDENDKTLPLAFMSIRQKATDQSGQITYYSTRTVKAKHGDAAWGCLQAFSCEASFSEYEQPVSVNVYH